MKNHIFSYALLVAAAIPASGQTTPGSIPAPSPVVRIRYQHWPQQFVEWVGSELPYSMFELYVDPTRGSEPLYEVVLTDRATWKRTGYSNQQADVDINRKAGKDFYLAPMQFGKPDKPGPGAVYTLRFTDRNNAPVYWQFVQKSDTSEISSGLSPAGLQPPVLMYRERSAVAAEGTALKIGAVVSAADVWKEIAQPPYFVPYHAALSENVEIATFLDTAADEYALKVASQQGDTATFVQTGPREAVKVTLEARLVSGEWSVGKVHFEPTSGAAKGLTVNFTPDGAQGKFDVQAGKRKIASGVYSSHSWQFKDPAWLKANVTQAQAR